MRSGEGGWHISDPKPEEQIYEELKEYENEEVEEARKYLKKYTDEFKNEQGAANVGVNNENSNQEVSISSQVDKHIVCRLVPPKGLAVSTISWKSNGGKEVVSASGEVVSNPPTFELVFQI